MQLLAGTTEPIDLTTTPIHLGLGATASVIDGFSWDPAVLVAYGQAAADDGIEGRMVMIFDGDESWTSWERHPVGEEVVICLSGHATAICERDGEEVRFELTPGMAMINPKGAWHTADLHERTMLMTITPGAGTQHRPR
jgi:mannose-6-phosphate isomerase-like protein (cupin superfamily)